MNLKFIKKNTGFTLIELLVVISIILLITGGGIAGFINFNDKQLVQTTVKDIQTLMRAGQVKARSGEGAIECQTAGGFSNGKLRGYQVAQAVGAVVLNRVCVEGANTVYIERSRTTLDDTVSVTLSDSVVFLSLKGGVDVGSTNPATVTVSGNYTGLVYVYEVHPGGEITDGAFQ